MKYNNKKYNSFKINANDIFNYFYYLKTIYFFYIPQRLFIIYRIIIIS